MRARARVIQAYGGCCRWCQATTALELDHVHEAGQPTARHGTRQKPGPGAALPYGARAGAGGAVPGCDAPPALARYERP